MISTADKELLEREAGRLVPTHEVLYDRAWALGLAEDVVIRRPLRKKMRIALRQERAETVVLTGLDHLASSSV